MVSQLLHQHRSTWAVVGIVPVGKTHGVVEEGEKEDEQRIRRRGVL
jgi:hypothetical protein